MKSGRIESQSLPWSIGVANDLFPHHLLYIVGLRHDTRDLFYYSISSSQRQDFPFSISSFSPYRSIDYGQPITVNAHIDYVGPGGANVARLPVLRPIPADNVDDFYLSSSGHCLQMPMIGPCWLRPSWMSPRLETRSQLLSYRTRGKEDSDYGGYCWPWISPEAYVGNIKGYNDTAIPLLLTSSPKVLFLFNFLTIALHYRFA